MRRRLAAPLSTGKFLAGAIVVLVLMGVLNVGLNALLFRSLCEVIAAQAAVFAEVPPSTPTGVRAADAWRSASRNICRV